MNDATSNGGRPAASSDGVPESLSEPMGRRDQAVARSLAAARSRAETRVQRFIDAAFELMARSGGSDFTVQQVVETSGQSLRSFYQYFDGKHELMLALFEEAIRVTVERLGQVVDAEPDPAQRLRVFVLEYHRLCTPAPHPRAASRRKGDPPPSPVLAEFAQRLLTSDPADATRAFRPLVALFEDVLAQAAEAGAARSDLDSRRVAGVVLEAVMFSAFSATISGAQQRAEDDAEGLWRILAEGITP